MSKQQEVEHSVISTPHVSGGQGWVRLYISETAQHLSMSPSQAMELARKLVEIGWDQR